MFVQEQKGHGEVWCFSAELEPIKSPDIQSFIFTEASQLVCAVCNSSWWTKDSSEPLNRTNNCREGEQEGRKEGLLCLGVYGGKTIKDGGGHGERETWQSEVAVVWQPVRLRLHVSDLCLFCPPEDVMVVQHDTFRLSRSIYSSVCHRRVFRCF